MPDLRAQILAAIERGERLAQRAYDAEPGGWSVVPAGVSYAEASIVDANGDTLAWVGHANDAALIATVASPDAVLRHYAAARRTLDRHRTDNELHASHDEIRCCVGCSWADSIEVMGWPCIEVLDLADSLGIEATR